MILIFTSALLLSIGLPDSLLKNTSSFALKVHEKCVHVLPKNSEHADSIASLVCGEKITDEKLKQNLSKTSLIHIFVISGSHLILLDEFLSIFKIPVLVRFLFLFVYSLISGWQAPAVRALLGMGIRKVLRDQSLHLPGDLVVLLTGLVLLFFFPSWWSSLSLQMSWCAALALSSVSLWRIKGHWDRIIISQFTIYLFMVGPLWGLGSLHPLSILYNLVLAPIVSFVLLPLSFLTPLSPWILHFFDSVMSVFITALEILSEPIHLKRADMPTVGFLWSWILFLHITLHFARLKKWQGQDSA